MRRGGEPQTFNEGVCSELIPATQREVKDQLGSPFNRDERVGIADCVINRGLLGCLVGFFLADETPDLFALDILDRNVGTLPKFGELLGSPSRCCCSLGTLTESATRSALG